MPTAPNLDLFIHKCSLRIFYRAPCDSVLFSLSLLFLSLHIACLLVEAWALTVQTQGSWREENIQRGAAIKAPLKPSFCQAERKCWREPTTSRWAQTARRTWRTVTPWCQSGSSHAAPEQRDWASASGRPGPWLSLEKIVLVQRWCSMQRVWDSTRARHVWNWKHRWVLWCLPESFVTLSPCVWRSSSLHEVTWSCLFISEI